MRIQTQGTLAIAGALAVALFALGAGAQENVPAATSAGATNVAPAQFKPVANATNQASQPAVVMPGSGAADILKMLDAGVSKDVVITYIQTLPGGWSLSGADLIALKQHGVPDDVVMELLKHHAPAVVEPAAASANPPESSTASQPSQPVVVVRSGRLDPESYDYFQHYYLYPRTLAYVNQTLGYNPAPFNYGYGYGYAPYYYGRPRRFFGPGY